MRKLIETPNHALKTEDLNISQHEANLIRNVLVNFASKLGYSPERIENLECRRRDGFIPHSHNKGGIECMAFTDQESARFQGTGFENADKTLDKYYQFDIEMFHRDSDRDLQDNPGDWSEADWSAFDEWRSEDDQSTVLYSLDIMLNSENELNLRFCICVKDAPYHREYDDMIDIDVEFNSVADLEDQLNNILQYDQVKLFADCLLEAY